MVEALMRLLYLMPVWEGEHVKKRLINILGCWGIWWLLVILFVIRSAREDRERYAVMVRDLLVQIQTTMEGCARAEVLSEVMQAVHEQVSRALSWPVSSETVGAPAGCTEGPGSSGVLLGVSLLNVGLGVGSMSGMLYMYKKYVKVRRDI